MQTNQHNIEGKEQNWKTDATQLQDLWSYSNQGSVTLMKEYTNKLMGQNREPKGRITYI